LLYDDQRVATNLRDLDDDDDDDDRLACYYASSWFQTCCTTLNLLGKILSLDDVVLEDKTTQTCESHVIDEVGSFTGRKKHK
jgi:hypothetical protein